MHTTRDIESVWVHPRCGVQTAEKRFGRGARRAIYDTLFLDANDGADDGSLDGNNEDAAAAAAADAPAYDFGDDDDDLDDADIPRVSRARINLTALSQHYNLYFAVYGDRIHVYRPQPAPEILRGPVLVIRPERSREAKQVGGYLDPRNPHHVNHAIVGDLGREEILLLACDDGDVLAYYTRHILDCIVSRGRRQHALPARRGPLAKPPRPFMHENVGHSAWGLAIHAQSRVIAVSSNLVEINVFAFALYPSGPTDPHRFKTTPLSVPAHDSSPTTLFGISAMELEERLRARDRDWRILLPLDAVGYNMPSIAFVDDAEGNAEKVAAIDIYGYAWLLDIWKVGRSPITVSPPNDGRFGGQFKGWGILVLPASAFIKTKKMPVGTTWHQYAGGSYINIARDMNHVRDNDPLLVRQPPPGALFSRSDPSSEDATGDLTSLSVGGASSAVSEASDDDGDDDDGDGDDDDENDDNDDGGDDDDDDGDSTSSAISTSSDLASAHAQQLAGLNSAAARHWNALLPSSKLASARTPQRGSSGDSGGDADDKNGRDGKNIKDSRDKDKDSFSLRMAVCPSLGLVWPGYTDHGMLHILRESRFRCENSRAVMLNDAEAMAELYQMGERCVLLRTYDMSAEIFSTNVKEPSVFFERVLEPPRPRLPLLWDMDRSYNRLSLLHVIPEIGLVVVGGMFGRVVLLRLVRTSRPLTARRSGMVAPWHSFRAEWVLPRRDEERKGMLPPCCLLGIAVSPVPETGARRPDDDDPPPLRRWRLILHYMDHTILQYYIEEKKPRGEQLRVYSG